jgi:hypothetical protein
MGVTTMNNRKALEALAELGESGTIPQESFAINWWDDGEKCCLIGWAAKLPKFQAMGISLGPLSHHYSGADKHQTLKYGEFSGMSAAKKWLQCSNWEEDFDWIFTSSYYGGDEEKITPLVVAERIREYLIAGIPKDVMEGY